MPWDQTTADRAEEVPPHARAHHLAGARPGTRQLRREFLGVSAVALVLVLIAALAHATWNTCATKPIITNPSRKYPDMQVRRL
jgi:hypothetical protein